MSARVVLLAVVVAFAMWINSQAGSLAAAETADKAQPISPSQVQLTGWLGQRVEANWKHRLATVSLDERLRTFSNPTEAEGWSGEHIGKWLHAACLAWSYSHDAALKKRIDQSVAALVACQAPDGYLGTYAKDKRWGGWDVWTHKYNLIGLLSCYEYTGNQQALAAARKIGDLLLDTFGEGKRDIIRSGTHVGMAATSVLEPLVQLYRATSDPRYLEFARYIVKSYDQPHGPKIIKTLTETRSVHKTANGKAYEMMSNLVGLCELYRATGDERLLKPCLYAYDDIVANRMYLTGGTSLGEHFQADHNLPNTGAVSENCAQVTWEQLCAQLLRITGEAKYADTLECTVYNHLLASQNPSGDALCYFTALQGKKPYDKGCNCCTSSGPRGIALVTTFIYTTAPNAVMVNFYENSTLESTLGGVKTRITQHTRYPVDGKVLLSMDPAKPVQFELRLRIPGWCKDYEVKVNGKKPDAKGAPGTYLALSRQWHSGDTVEIDFAMPAVLVKGTHTNEGLVAVERGPLVLAFDSRLNPGLSPTNVSPVAAADGTVKLSLVADPEGITAQAFSGEGLTAVVENDQVVQKKVPLALTSFAEAGRSGSNFAVWLPSPERLKRSASAPFLFAKETYSQQGNIEGSIADGETSTWRVTFNGQKQSEAWFAVERVQPAAIDTVVYAHGQCYHDGGWFDAAQGKPRIQIKKTAGGKWEDAAAIEAYPATTATDNKGLANGKEFKVKIPAAQVVGIRVIGTPACGDNAKQSFASCAELQGFLEKKE